MKGMIKCGLFTCNGISKFDKCEKHVKSKIVKNPFHSVERNSEY